MDGSGLRAYRERSAAPGLASAGWWYAWATRMSCWSRWIRIRSAEVCAVQEPIGKCPLWR